MRTRKFASEISWPLKNVTDEIGKDHFTIVRGEYSQYFGPENQNPSIYFTGNYFSIASQIFFPNLNADLMRKNPFSLEELAKVKIATSGVDLPYLPIMIKDELKKYQELNKTFIGLADWQYHLTHYGAPGTPTPQNTPNWWFIAKTVPEIYSYSAVSYFPILNFFKYLIDLVHENRIYYHDLLIYS